MAWLRHYNSTCCSVLTAANQRLAMSPFAVFGLELWWMGALDKLSDASDAAYRWRVPRSLTVCPLCHAKNSRRELLFLIPTTGDHYSAAVAAPRRLATQLAMAS